MKPPFSITYDNHGNGGFAEWWDISDADHEPIARCNKKEDAETILLAVNSHAALLEVCRALLDAKDEATTPQHYAYLVDDVCELAHAAIRQATETQP